MAQNEKRDTEIQAMINRLNNRVPVLTNEQIDKMIDGAIKDEPIDYASDDYIIWA